MTSANSSSTWCSTPMSTGIRVPPRSGPRPPRSGTPSTSSAPARDCGRLRYARHRVRARGRPTRSSSPATRPPCPPSRRSSTRLKDACRTRARPSSRSPAPRTSSTSPLRPVSRSSGCRAAHAEFGAAPRAGRAERPSAPKRSAYARDPSVRRGGCELRPGSSGPADCPRNLPGSDRELEDVDIDEEILWDVPAALTQAAQGSSSETEKDARPVLRLDRRRGRTRQAPAPLPRPGGRSRPQADRVHGLLATGQGRGLSPAELGPACRASAQRRRSDPMICGPIAQPAPARQRTPPAAANGGGTSARMIHARTTTIAGTSRLDELSRPAGSTRMA
jgi:hypothetical protein